ncbi:MAG: acyl carrier protein [Exilibacterium sp.]
MNKNAHYDQQLYEEVHLLWAEILKLNHEALDENSDFFVLGGSSLQGMALAYKLQSVYEVDITLLDIVHCKCIANVTNLISKKIAENGFVDEEEGFL